MKYKNKLLFIISFILLTSCTKHDVKDTISPDSLAWLFDGNIGDIIMFKDSNLVSYSYSLQESQGFNYETGYTVYGLDSNLSNIDDYRQKFTVSYGHNYNMLVSASYPPYGDIFYVSIGDTNFQYDFRFNKIIQVEEKQRYKSLGMVNDSYDNNTPIYSTIEYLDSYVVNEETYFDIMHFTLNDFTDTFDDLTVTEIYLAKHEGLIYYKLHNGVIYEKQ